MSQSPNFAQVRPMTEIITLLSWNINGIRAAYKKGFPDWLGSAAPDILCLQETRAGEDKLPATLAQPVGYHGYWNASRARKGYSGTATLTRPEPLEVRFGLGVREFDQEGRTIISRYPTFTLISCYFPNGGRDHSRVPFKLAFYDAFLEKCENLRAQGQTVIFCGDVNTAHKEIDLARPRDNQNTSGFLPEERAWVNRFLQAGYVDTFRHFHPELGGQYTWWSVPTRARERNIGWRLDYFFIACEAIDRVADAFILPEVTGSDHCPVGLRLAV
jgi:exodeoxyribonuclease-3